MFPPARKGSNGVLYALALKGVAVLP